MYYVCEYVFSIGCLTGMGYPTGKITLAGAGMGKISYPRAGAGFLAGKV